MWFLLSLFYIFLNVSKFRTKNIIYDTSIYIDLFEDLDKVNDVYKNAYILSYSLLTKKVRSYYSKIII
jgi:hypothetical protein